ncbi:glycosyltransferase [Flavobacterium sp.]|uniref:glycosyltransferase family 2 protein n=1 Tax=Flavobacterium sp. TaxID=239 RepID=UPI00286D7FF7|nr:glycosyltransferase [Flavobacterium sp.]
MTVSVSMITYNHELYLKQAIASVLMQETDFEYELVIANDNSPDNSDEIIREFIKSDPNGHKIKYLHRKENLGMMPNFIDLVKNCNGKYIAICEGDDYWTDKKKLQKQIDFLEKNKGYVICYHEVDIEKNNVIIADNLTYGNRKTTTIKNLAKRNYIHTCSVVYKNNLFDSFPEYFHSTPIGDYFLHMLNARYGKLYCIKEKMAVYRVHENSYWSSKKETEQKEIWARFLKNIMPNFDYKIQNYLQVQIEKTTGTFKKKNIFKKLKQEIYFFYKDVLKL